MQTSAAVAVKPLMPIADVIQLIPVDKIDPSPRNARKEFSKEYIAEIGASIARDGQQQAGKVRPLKNGRFQLIYGECRWRGAKIAGVEMYKAVVEEMDDSKADRLCLIENLKRRDLTVFEEAEHLKMLHEQYKVKIDDLAQQVGISVRSVYEALKLATAAPEVRKAVSAEPTPLPVSHAKLIARLPKAEQAKLVAEVMDEADYNGMITHDGLEEQIREKYMVDLRTAPFETNLKGIACVSDDCIGCARNARNAKDEFPELKGADVCTSPENYRKKCEAFAKAVMADAKKNGKTVLEGAEAEKAASGQGGYVTLASEVWVGSDRKPLKTVLPKKSELKTALVTDDEGNVVEVAKREDVQEALKKAGKTAIANSYEVTSKYSSPASSGGSSHNDEQTKRRKKLEARREVAGLAIDAIAEHQHTTDGNDTFVKLLGLGLAKGRVDNDGLQKMLKRNFGAEKKTEYGPDAAAKLIEGAKGVELRRIAARIAMSEGLTAGGTWSDSHAAVLLGGLKLYGLKLERFQDDAKKLKDAKTAEKKAPPKKDPLDSPAVAKAKAAKAKSKKKGGGK